VRKKLLSNLKLSASSIRGKYLFFILMFIIFPIVLLSVYLLFSFKNILVENANKSYVRILSGIGSNLEVETQDMIAAAKYISFDTTVLKSLNDSEKNGYIDIDEAYNIENILLNLQTNYFNYYFQINIITRNGAGISNSSDYLLTAEKNATNSEWYKQAIDNPGINVWMPHYFYKEDNQEFTGTPTEQMLVATAVTDYSTNKVMGVVTVSIPQDQFSKMVFSSTEDKFSSDETILVFDDKNQLIISSNPLSGDIKKEISKISKVISNPDKLSIMKIGNAKYLADCVTVKNLNWKLVQLVPYNKTVSDVNNLTFRIGFILLFIFAILIIVVIKFSDRLTKPIRELVNQMKEMGHGNLDVHISSQKGTTNEIYVLENEFNRMVVKQRELISRITEKERKIQETQRKESELKYKMLMAQINPHFLFNTLNTIKWSALMSGAQNVATMISHLGNLLEMSINRSGDTITLQEEIKNVESYFYIQKIRFCSSIVLECNISEDTTQCVVPKLILQPLVENSIIHAFTKQEYGKISISSYKTQTELIVIVADNGKGINQDLLRKKLAKNSYKETMNKFSGIGINNVNERIKLRYGTDYGLEFESNEGSGTKVIVRLPIKGLDDSFD